MSLKKRNMVEEITFMMDEANSRTLYSTLERLKDLEQTDRDGRTVLINAAFCGRLDVAKWALSHGAKVNAADKMGFTALHAAVQEVNTEMIRLLISNGADVNVRNNFGNNVIFLVRPNHPQELYELLLRNGADPTMKNNYGNSAADLWNAANYPEFAKAYLKYKT